MKTKLTRRPGPANKARVTVLEIVADGPDEEELLGKLAIDIGAVDVPEAPPPFKGDATKPTPPRRKATLAEAAKRIGEIVKGAR